MADMHTIPSFRIEKGQHDNEISVIDMTALDGQDRAQTLVQIARACESHGFFKVVNHGIDFALLEKVKKVYQELFDLPENEKLEFYKGDKPQTQGYHKRTLVGDNESSIVMESFSRRMNEQSPWPSIPENFRDIFSEYTKEIVALGDRLLAGLSEILGLPEQSLKNQFESSGNSLVTIRANYYHPWSTDKPDPKSGAHCDPGGITLLLVDEVPGLQFKVSNRWQDIEPDLTNLFINIGGQIEILSNGRFKSPEHRGTANLKKRFSLVAFYSPAVESMVGPMKELIDETHPARYETTNYAEYIRNFLEKLKL